MTEDWQKPSEALKRIAEARVSPLLEKCPTCPHHSHRGERCGFPTGVFGSVTSSFCECVK